MFTVDNKFELNQQVFVIRKEHRTIEKKETCNICLGEGKISYKGYSTSCPKCHGKRETILEEPPGHSAWQKSEESSSYDYKFSVFGCKAR